MSNETTSGATVTDEANESSERPIVDPIDRVLASDGTRAGVTLFGSTSSQAQALQARRPLLRRP